MITRETLARLHEALLGTSAVALVTVRSGDLRELLNAYWSETQRADRLAAHAAALSPLPLLSGKPTMPADLLAAVGD